MCTPLRVYESSPGPSEAQYGREPREPLVAAGPTRLRTGAPPLNSGRQGVDRSAPPCILRVARGRAAAAAVEHDVCLDTAPARFLRFGCSL